MEPEIPTVSTGSKKKFLIIASAVILVVAGVSLGYLFMQKDTPEKEIVGVASSSVTQEKKVYTQAEKEQILAQLASALPKDTATLAEKTRILNSLSKKLPTNTISDAEKLRILEALASSTKQ